MVKLHSKDVHFLKYMWFKKKINYTWVFSKRHNQISTNFLSPFTIYFYKIQTLYWRNSQEIEPIFLYTFSITTSGALHLKEIEPRFVKSSLDCVLEFYYRLNFINIRSLILNSIEPRLLFILYKTIIFNFFQDKMSKPLSHVSM